MTLNHKQCRYRCIALGDHHHQSKGHFTQEPRQFPWNGEGPCLSSEGCTMGVGKAILCSDKPSNIVGSENGPCWGTIAYFIGGEKGQPCLIRYISSSSIFSKKNLYWQERKWEHDGSSQEKRENLVVFALYWCLHMIVQHVVDMHVLALNGEWKTAMILSICFESMNMSDCCGHLKKNVGSTDRLLLGFFTGKTFKQRTRVCHIIHIWKRELQLRVELKCHYKVLGLEFALCTAWEEYEVAKSIIPKIVRNFYKLVRIHLQRTFVQYPNPTWSRVLGQ